MSKYLSFPMPTSRYIFHCFVPLISQLPDRARKRTYDKISEALNEFFMYNFRRYCDFIAENMARHLKALLKIFYNCSYYLF